VSRAKSGELSSPALQPKHVLQVSLRLAHPDARVVGSVVEEQHLSCLDLVPTEEHARLAVQEGDAAGGMGRHLDHFHRPPTQVEHEAVAESAAVGKPDAVNMEVVKAFVALKPGYEANADLELSIMNFIRKKLSPLAMPQEIEFVESLPKTRSGKIMRRLLRAKEWGQEIGDTSTLEND